MNFSYLSTFSVDNIVINLVDHLTVYLCKKDPFQAQKNRLNQAVHHLFLTLEFGDLDYELRDPRLARFGWVYRKRSGITQPQIKH